VRYFSDGAVIGSKSYINGIFESQRSRYGEKRKTGARPMRGIAAGNLQSMRDLRIRPIG
jgi:putative transposase